MRTPRQTTTEEHQPPAASDGGRGQPVLLAAFPALAACPIPPSNEVIGREWFEKKGVKDGEISSLHLRFSWVEDRLHIEDIDSTNGVYVDGVCIAVGAPVELKDGAVLRLGKTLLVYRENFTGPLPPEGPLGELVGPWGLTAVREAVDRLRPHEDLNVLIEGETGTGKEHLAKVVAEALEREPMGTINMPNVTASMFEATLYGWKKGAYSSAVVAGPGVLRAHEPGAVLLDEIGELSLEVQTKLLRLIENRDILPVGAAKSIKINLALIAATNRFLETAVEEGTFRRDLLARFPTRLEITPLRDRLEDLFTILQKLQERRGTPLDLSKAEVEAVELLMLQKWPENVRGLDRFARLLDPSEPLKLAAVKRVLAMAFKLPESCKEAAQQAAQPVAIPPPATSQEPVAPRGTRNVWLAQADKQLLEETLHKTGGNQSQAARILGMSPNTIGRWIKKYGIKLKKR